MLMNTLNDCDTKSSSSSSVTLLNSTQITNSTIDNLKNSQSSTNLVVASMAGALKLEQQLGGSTINGAATNSITSNNSSGIYIFF